MPLANFWGATVNRSVPGLITLALTAPVRPQPNPEDPLPPFPDAILTIDRVPNTPAIPLNETEADCYAAYFWINDTILGPWEIPSNNIWDYRCQYARNAWRVLQYDRLIKESPGTRGQQWRTKRQTYIAERDRYKALCGE